MKKIYYHEVEGGQVWVEDGKYWKHNPRGFFVINDGEKIKCNSKKEAMELVEKLRKENKDD